MITVAVCRHGWPDLGFDCCVLRLDDLCRTSDCRCHVNPLKKRWFELILSACYFNVLSVLVKSPMNKNN
jgi:hypothetical protein